MSLKRLQTKTQKPAVRTRRISTPTVLLMNSRQTGFMRELAARYPEALR